MILIVYLISSNYYKKLIDTFTLAGVLNEIDDPIDV